MPCGGQGRGKRFYQMSEIATQLTVRTEPNAGCYDYLGLNMPFPVVQGNIYCMSLRSFFGLRFSYLLP